MEGEIYNFICVWITIYLSLFYCHTLVGKNIPKGTIRLLALTPIISLFFFLPLNLTTMLLGGLTSFFIAWLATFKLLLFAFGKGPLTHSNSLPISLSRFLLVACLPIKMISNDVVPSPPPSQNLEKVAKKGQKSVLNYASKAVIFSTLLMVFDFKKDIHHPLLKMALYGLFIYVALDIGLAVFATMAKSLIGEGFELEPHFDEPYLATSLQDFWGRRWNLVVSSILRPTVYHPVKSISTRLLMIPMKWAPLPAIFATFLVSGMMHELIFYYIGRLRPTGAVTCFFVLHGVCLDIEIVLKKLASDGKLKLKLHPIVSRPLALGFVLVSSFWLFFPPLFQFKAGVRQCQESIAFINFVRHGKLISPNHVSCPFNYDL